MKNLGFFLSIFFMAIGYSCWAGLLEDIVNPANTRAITAAKINAKDYRLKWKEKAPEGIVLEIDPESIEWMRVRELLILPRARILVKSPVSTVGVIRGLGFTAPLLNSGITHFPIPLLASEELKLSLELKEGNQIKSYEFMLEYVGHESFSAFYDSSCSRFQIFAQPVEVKSGGWASFACVNDPLASSDGQSASLQILSVWQRTQRDYEIDSIKDSRPISDVIEIRASPNLGKNQKQDYISLSSGEQKFHLNYKLPSRIHKGSFGVGVGPYAFNFEENEKKDSKTILMPTFYGAYATSSTTRLVAFEATPLAHPWTVDLGTYLSYESFRFFDKRLSFQILLGAHMIAFDTHDGYKFLFGAPQGAELIGTDIFARGYNAAVGAFIFPWIGGKAYNNMWVRWGNKNVFAEINYIMWREEVKNVHYKSQSLGVTLGMPIPALSFL